MGGVEVGGGGGARCTFVDSWDAGAICFVVTVGVVCLAPTTAGDALDRTLVNE